MAWTGEPAASMTLSVLTALGRENEIGMHVRGALRNGLTPQEIGEMLHPHRDLRRRARGQRGLRDRQRGDRSRDGTGRTEDPPVRPKLTNCRPETSPGWASVPGLA